MSLTGDEIDRSFDDLFKGRDPARCYYGRKLNKDVDRVLGVPQGVFVTVKDGEVFFFNRQGKYCLMNPMGRTWLA